MISSILPRRITLFGTMGLLCLAAAVIAFVVWGYALGSGDPPDWPELTMKYELDEGTLKHEFEYRGWNDWRSTVVEAPTVGSGAGSYTQQDSYREVKEGYITVYDSETGTKESTPLEPGEYDLPAARLMPVDFSLAKDRSDAAPVERSTSAKLCFDDACQENATGWVFAQDNGKEYIYADDTRGIPLALPGITITEVKVTGAQRVVPRD